MKNSQFSISKEVDWLMVGYFFLVIWLPAYLVPRLID